MSIGQSSEMMAISPGAHVIEEQQSHFENRSGLSRSIGLLQRYMPIGDEIIGAWLAYEEHRDKSWRAHQDINEVMLATALIPNTFLSISRALPQQKL